MTDIGKFKITNNKYIENELIANLISLLRRLSCTSESCTRYLDMKIEPIKRIENTNINENGNITRWTVSISDETCCATSFMYVHL